VLVVPITTALHRLAPTKFLLGSSLVLDVGQKLDVEQMRTRLEASGYRCVDTVYEHGEFAVRGALIDLFPMGSNCPTASTCSTTKSRPCAPSTRRTSAPSTRSIRSPAAGARIPLQKEAVTRFKARFRERFDVDFRRCPIFQDLAAALPRPVSSTTCRCSSKKPRPCSTTCRRTPRCSRCRASNRPPETSGTTCATAMKSAASTPPAAIAAGRTVPAGGRLLRPAQELATGGGQRETSSRASARTLPARACRTWPSKPRPTSRWRAAPLLDQFPGRVLFTAESAGAAKCCWNCWNA
jgi:transcription-repair coupling factor (superfamily II helicase)